MHNLCDNIIPHINPKYATFAERVRVDHKCLLIKIVEHI